jgi:hypothetical protein
MLNLPTDVDIFMEAVKVFCINTGRAGSQYLASLLEGLPGVCSLHEPEPCMIGEFLRMVETKPLTETAPQRSFKADAIRSICAAVNCDIYCETSHMFIKTFYDVVCSQLSPVRVVHLRRPLGETLRSFVEMAYFTTRNKAWPLWMSSPYAATAAIAYPTWELDPIDTTIAYLIDIEARAQRFRKEHPNVPVLETTLARLNTTDGVRQLVGFIGCHAGRESLTSPGRKVNERGERKRHFAIAVDEADLQRRINKFLERLDRAGVAVPPGLLI